MLVDIVKFLVVSGCSFFLFCAVGNILLNDLESYSSISSALLTLFAACLGDFNFGEFDELDHPLVGIIFMSIFLIFMMVTLLNFVIAILSDTYANNQEKGTALYLKEVILLDSYLGESETDTWRVSAFVPMNLVIHIIALPCLIFKASPVKLNRVLLSLCYSPVYIIGLICTFTVGLIHIFTMLFEAF